MMKAVRRFIGMVSWYRRFIPDFAPLIPPISKLTRKIQKFIWTQEADTAFLRVKELLISDPILACPDFSRTFTLQCDASLVGLGCVLTQEFDDGKHVIAYASMALTTQEAKFPALGNSEISLLCRRGKIQCY
ncbi:hypothetical protein JTB14_003882 [Gonioctena quinquepunctata]|nr:hypothetical protein JTB14_003882 [Gonioctena quinquepunctata]